jgi:V8-like Glu-specific endopeptidase
MVKKEPKEEIEMVESKEQVFPEEYSEDIEEAFEGAEEELEAEAGVEAEPGTTAEYEAEEREELEDHDEVSSEEPVEVEGELEPPEYGEEGAPPVIETDLEIEPMEGYDESILEMDREEAQADEARLLDAWYAEFADPATIALVQQQPGLSQTVAEVVIGRDDRVQITNTTAYPWRTICSLIITARDGSRWIGTGWLVGPRTVITAGHCVYMHKRGGWARSIEVIPGRNAVLR